MTDIEESPKTQKNPRAPPGSTFDFLDAPQFLDFSRLPHDDLPRDSLGFLNLNNWDIGLSHQDFPRESLGILNFNKFDVDQDLLNFSYQDVGKESLGIINLNNLDITRPSIGINSLGSYDLAVRTPDLDRHKTFCIKDASTLLSEVLTPPVNNVTLKTTPLWKLPPLDTTRTIRSDDIFEVSLDKSDINEEKETVFAEAAHLSWRVGSGSFLEDDMLDMTQEPADFINVSTDDEEPIKCDTETVFKKVDQLFTQPPVTPESNIPNTDTEALNQSQGTPESTELDTSTNDKSPCKSKKVLTIIRRLSKLFDNPKSSPTQKEEGQALLSNLAKMYLGDSRKRSNSFSVDYSVESPPTASESSQLYEALDLRSTDSVKDHIELPVVPLDLSMKSKSGSEKSFCSPRVLPLPVKIQKKPNFNVNHSSLSNYSASSNESRQGVEAPKFKSRRLDEKAAKKGPMRATLPLDTMAKRGNSPKRTAPGAPLYKTKKTSTPIVEKQSKLLGQTTPDNQRMSCSISPLARPSSSLRTMLAASKADNSKSRLPLNKSLEGKKPTSLLRRSSGDLKNTHNPGKPLVRSNSLVEKQAVLNKFDSNAKGPVLKDTRTKCIRRPSLVKKIGKENAAK